MDKNVQISIRNVLTLISVMIIFVTCAGTQKLVGKTFFDERYFARSLVDCGTCCKSEIHKADLCFIQGSDTVLLIGTLDGIQIGCEGTECDLEAGLMQCTPVNNTKYELTGYYLPPDKYYSIRKFMVTNCKVIDK